MKSRARRNRKYWNKIIKDNQWFDYIYLVKLIKHQINYMIINWDKSYNVEKDSIKKELQELLKDINLYIDDRFDDKYLKVIDEKYGTSEIQELPNGRITIKRPYETPDTDREFLEAIEKGKKDRDACKARIFDTMRDRIEFWWD